MPLLLEISPSCGGQITKLTPNNRSSFKTVDRSFPRDKIYKNHSRWTKRRLDRRRPEYRPTIRGWPGQTGRTAVPSWSLSGWWPWSGLCSLPSGPENGFESIASAHFVVHMSFSSYEVSPETVATSHYCRIIECTLIRKMIPRTVTGLGTYYGSRLFKTILVSWFEVSSTNGYQNQLELVYSIGINPNRPAMLFSTADWAIAFINRGSVKRPLLKFE